MSAGLQVDGYVLGLEVLLDPFGTALAAEARLLDPAARRRRVGDHSLVEPDHAGLELLADAQRALQVARAHVGPESELGVVGRRDRLVLGGESLYRRDRSEDLLGQEPGVVGYVGQHGGVVEVAGAVASVAADERLGTAPDRVLDEL